MLKNVPFKLDEYIFDKELQHTDDFICVALYFFSAGCFVIEISVKKMKKTPKKPYETKSGEVYKRDGSTLKHVKSVWLRNICFSKVATTLFKFIDRFP